MCSTLRGSLKVFEKSEEILSSVNKIYKTTNDQHKIVLDDGKILDHTDIVATNGESNESEVVSDSDDKVNRATATLVSNQ